MPGAARLLAQPVLQRSYVIAGQFQFARGLHDNFHIARPRLSARTGPRNIDKDPPAHAGMNDRKHCGPIHSAGDILPQVERDAIARREPPQDPVHTGAQLRHYRRVTIRGDDKAVAFEAGDAKRHCARRMLAHDRAMHVRAIGEMQHRADFSQTGLRLLHARPRRGP